MGITTLQTKSTRLLRAIQYRSGSFQDDCEENVSNPRKSPAAIRERNPAQNHLWCCPGPTMRINPIAKNNPDNVGMITLPAQLVRFRIPFSNDIAPPTSC